MIQQSNQRQSSLVITLKMFHHDDKGRRQTLVELWEMELLHQNPKERHESNV